MLTTAVHLTNGVSFRFFGKTVVLADVFSFTISLPVQFLVLVRGYGVILEFPFDESNNVLGLGILCN